MRSRRSSLGSSPGSLGHVLDETGAPIEIGHKAGRVGCMRKRCDGIVFAWRRPAPGPTGKAVLMAVAFKGSLLGHVDGFPSKART